MFHVVYCRSRRELLDHELAGWIFEAAAFDEMPRLDPPGGNARAFEVIYDERKRPLQLVHVSGERLAARVNELIDEAEEACDDPALIARLRDTAQAISIEIDEVGATEEAWELLEDLDTRIARELDGVIHVPGEAVQDADGHVLCSFDEPG
jgi:hypothetical protein